MLPNLSTSKPVYQLTLPTTQKLIEYSPYTNNQQKALLIAAQEDDYGSLISTLQNLLNDCCSTTLDNVIDFTYVLTHIKSKSHGGSHSFTINSCECGHKNIEIEVEDIIEHLKIKNQENLKSTYKLTDKISLRLCPTKIGYLKDIKMDDTAENKIAITQSMIANSIDFVVNDKEIIKDFTREEIIENIVQHLTPKQIEEINEEIGKLISIFFEVKYFCPKCEKEFGREISDFLF